MSDTSLDTVSVLYVGQTEQAADALVTALEDAAQSLDIAVVLSMDAAVERIESHHVDCIVSRYELPGSADGIALLEALRDRGIWLPFVLLPDDSTDAASRAVEAGVDRYQTRTTVEETVGPLIDAISGVVEEYQPRMELLDRMTDAFMAVDDQWRSTYFNERCRELLADALGGDSEIELHGRSIWDTIPGISDTRFEKQCRQAMAEQETRSFESYYERLDCWFDVRLFPSPTGLSMYFSEITDRREYEQMLEHREQVLRDIYSIISDKERDFHRKVEQLLEIGREELGMAYGSLSRIEGSEYTLSVVAGPDHEMITAGTTADLDQTNCQRVVETAEHLALADTAEEAPELTDRLVYELGIESYLGAPVFVEDDIDGSFCFYNLEPRSEPFSQWELTLVDLMGSWVSYERERERQQAQLQHERDRLDAVAGTLSHDIRNPLTTANLRLELAAEECTSEHIGAAEDALKRIDDLIENTLSMARLGTDALELTTLQLDLVANRAWETAIDTEATLDLDDGLGTLVADESALQQLLENLFANAADHGRPADGDLVVRVGSLPDDGFFVADNGPGIPAETQDEIFERGYSRHSDGTGFGLSIVSRIVDAHDWTVTVTDAEGGGARFEIRT